MSNQKRQKFSLGVRFRVLAKSNFRCAYCGVEAKKTRLHIDHVNPLANGGMDDPNNFRASCKPCNEGKGSQLLEDLIP